MDRQFEKALSVERSELLTERVKPKKKVFPLVLGYNPILSVVPAYRRTKNLKEILAPSKFGGSGSVNHTWQETGGFFKCNKRCDLRQKFLIQDTKFPRALLRAAFTRLIND